jgi:hypothetical protein
MDNPTEERPAVTDQDSALGQLVEKIARVCHEANRAYCITIGDNSHESWPEAFEWQRESSRAGVRAVLTGRIQNPGDAHREWLAHKKDTGWKFGAVKDPVSLTHPSMLPFEQLPHDEQLKDYLFMAVVNALDPYADVPSKIRRSPFPDARA